MNSSWIWQYQFNILRFNNSLRAHAEAVFALLPLMYVCFNVKANIKALLSKTPIYESSSQRNVTELQMLSLHVI